MIIIPPHATVLILPPRTGSGSLKKAVLRDLPGSFMLYRHMEADGVPAGYDRWRRIGVVRDPVERLWSLYNFLGTLGNGKHSREYAGAMRKSVERPFEDWLLHNETVFTDPHDRTGDNRFYPAYCVRHAMAENRKSQALYIRPDLGGQWVDFRGIKNFATHDLGVNLDLHENAAAPSEPPNLSDDAKAFMWRFHAWDLRVTLSDRAGPEPEKI